MRHYHRPMYRRSAGAGEQWVEGRSGGARSCAAAKVTEDRSGVRDRMESPLSGPPLVQAFLEGRNLGLAGTARLLGAVGNSTASALVAQRRQADGRREQRPCVQREVFPQDESSEEDASESVQTRRDTETTPEVQRQDIPPPPHVFPANWDFGTHGDLHDDRVEAWNNTQMDDLERGFVVMLNERTGKLWATRPHLISRLTISKNSYRHDLDYSPVLPLDRPPVFPVGTFHTHPKPPKGMTSKPGPSYVDNADNLPGVMEDSTVRPYDPRTSGFYFFGPERRPQALPPRPPL